MKKAKLFSVEKEIKKIKKDDFDFDKWIENTSVVGKWTWKDEVIYYLIDKPFDMYTSIVSGIIHWEQRRVRGWDDSEVWSLDNTFAKFIYPRLIKLKEVTNGYPADLTEKKWDKILDKMVEGFKIMADDESYYELTVGKKDKKITEALNLFSKHCRDLWW